MKNLTSKILFIICIILALMWYLQYQENQSYKTEPNNLISNEEAESMRALYLENQYQFINQGLEARFGVAEKDFTEFTIPIENLKGYIYKTEQAAKENDYENLGIRFFLGAKKVNNTPKTTLFYRAVGSQIKDQLKKPIRYDKIPQMMEVYPGDKIESGGSNGGSGKPERTN
ncbi:hypothetical protein [Aestuariibaculum sediminum]|uniref:Uncharacterized protein n=1 Tax=Aestuariibaculum sediminum TaxID=2770637 RepID=A0A8J6U738_9FLAO|nr:hypothetical protein [Aestuariibaculum sediminum]MBD0831403.1 hypothetical protein [Aestuariibaculum sediminum]